MFVTFYVLWLFWQQSYWKTQLDNFFLERGFQVFILIYTSWCNTLHLLYRKRNIHKAKYRNDLNVSNRDCHILWLSHVLLMCPLNYFQFVRCIFFLQSQHSIQYNKFIFLHVMLVLAYIGCPVCVWSSFPI